MGQVESYGDDYRDTSKTSDHWEQRRGVPLETASSHFNNDRIIPPRINHRLRLIRKLGINPSNDPSPRFCTSNFHEAPDRLESTPFCSVVLRASNSDNDISAENVTTDTFDMVTSAEVEYQIEAEDRDLTEEPNFELNTVDLRSRDDFRVNYLKRLSYANVWVPNARRKPQHQTVIIFDWDDTLLCTSYINIRGDAIFLPCTQVQIELITKNVTHLLGIAMRMGRVFIITNAMEGWVEYSSRKYLPGLVPILSTIKIISARNSYEAVYPGEYHQWKIQAFLEVQRQLNSQAITNLISIGDSNIEMDAVHVMGKENPTPEELAKQLDLVGQKFEKICLNARNLKIGLERKWVQAPRPMPPFVPGPFEGRRESFHEPSLRPNLQDESRTGLLK